MSIQVKMRGGTFDEHQTFVGAPREVTVDTTSNTLVIHDGIKPGGHPLTPLDDFLFFKKDIIHEVEGIQNNIAQSHNHDDKYAQILHSHNDRYAPISHNHSNYVEKVNNLTSVFSKFANSYNGLCDNTGNDNGWYRTTRNGLIPYQPGGYSNIGTPSWRFNEGWFNTINASTVTIPKNGVTSSIEFPSYGNDHGFIRHIESSTDVSGMYFSVSDNFDNIDSFYFGGTPNGLFREGSHITSDGLLHLNRGLVQNNTTIDVGGRRIYFDGGKPDNAPDGSISFG